MPSSHSDLLYTVLSVPLPDFMALGIACLKILKPKDCLPSKIFLGGKNDHIPSGKKQCNSQNPA